MVIGLSFWTGWRTQAASLRQLGESDAASVILTAGAGALGVTLREGIGQRTQEMMDEHELALYNEETMSTTPSNQHAGQIGNGSAPDVRTLNSGVGMFWRAMIFVLFLLLMLTLTKILG